MIDESSGSTGTPYNWIRSLRERRHSHLFVSYFATYCFGAEPWITINAFSMGAWATGLNMGLALQRNSIVKNTGPDITKILHTLRFFGPRYPYLILGYPPFLKHLIDVAEAEGFPFKDYCLNALVGGEGMSEGLRDYLLRRFQKVYSGYGATDLEIGIAGETPLSVAIRRLARDNSEVRQKLFGKDSEKTIKTAKKWAVHTGSEKILNRMAEHHGIEHEKLSESHEILKVSPF
jgi:phenylacetate-CoA ligase